MSNFVVPGVYVQEQQNNLNPLTIDSRCLSAFAGITESGPLNKPVLIKSFTEYLNIFGGFDTIGVLPYSIFSYFKCGGKECIVVRVADTKNASCAKYTVNTPKGKILFTASSEGHWGNYLTLSTWTENKENFSVTLSYQNKTESFVHLSYNPNDERYFESYINSHSCLCTVKAEGIVSDLQPDFMKTFSGGKDGIAELTPGVFIGKYNGLEDNTGIGCFESRNDISLIAVPDICLFKNEEDIISIQRTLIDQAERFSGRFAILDVPKNLDVLAMNKWTDKMNSSFAAAYHPFIDITDPLDTTGIGTLQIPPSAAVCGCIAATDNEKGVFHPPANCLIDGAVGISQKLTMGEQEMLYTKGINVLRYFPGRGVKIWGAKTLSYDTNWKYINVRRTFTRVCASLKQGTRWAVFEPNDKNLRKRLVRQVSGFLLDLWNKGYFAGSTPEQGFYVRCDEELNPPENIDAGILTFEVGLAIVHPVEFFKITLSAEKNGSNVYIQDK